VLAYTIIAIELAILYTVFWYVFLREPKPYRLRGNAWGAYDGPDSSETYESAALHSLFKAAGKTGAGSAGQTAGHGDECGCQAEKEAKIRSASAIYEEWNTASTQTGSLTVNQTGNHTRPQVPLTAGELIRSQARGVERVTRDLPQAQVSGQTVSGAPHYAPYAPYSPVEQYRSKYKKLPPFLAELGDKLNRINVKLP